MRAHRRTEITVETDHVVVIRRAKFFRGWCEECEREVDMVSVADAQAVAGMAGGGATHGQGWHVREGQDSKMLVCMDSLLKSM